MMIETAIDRAHAAMQSTPEDDSARMRFYDRLAHSEVFLLLTAEPDDQSETITPALFDVDETQYVLAFDREERLAEFVGEIAPFAALSGRVIAQMLAGQGIGMGLNLDVAPSAILLPPEVMGWLHDTLDHTAHEVEARIEELRVPKGLPDQLIETLDTRLASAMGLAQSAYLLGVRYDTGGQGHLLGFVGAIPQAHGALTQLAADALTFSGIEAGALDVAFFAPDAAIVSRMDRVGLRFDIPQPQDSSVSVRPAPGSDPARPPRLK